jgi:hypothetical protein
VRESLAHLADRAARPRAGRRGSSSKSSIHSRERLALPIDAKMKDLATRNLAVDRRFVEPLLPSETATG